MFAGIFDFLNSGNIYRYLIFNNFLQCYLLNSCEYMIKLIFIRKSFERFTKLFGVINGNFKR